MSKHRQLGREALRIYKTIDSGLRQGAEYMGATCTRGCAHCCYQLVLVDLTEALAIADYLLTDRQWQGKVDAVVQDMKSEHVFLADPAVTRARYFREHHPCVFLGTNNDCRVYPVRPSACRLHYAVTPPEVCGHHSGKLRVARINFSAVRDWIDRKSKAAMIDAGFPCWFAPLQVIVPWAVLLLREGRAVFEAAHREARGVNSLSFWTNENDDSALAREAAEEIIESLIDADKNH